MKKKILIVAISAFMVILLISAFQVTLVSAQGLPELIPCEFQAGENSSVWWTTERAHAGTYSVLLSTLYPTPLSHYARVAMPYGDKLDSISSISYWEHYVKDWPESPTHLWGAWVSIALDTDSDGAADRWLLGDPSLQGWPCEWDNWVQRTFDDDTTLFISPVDFPTENTFTLDEWKAGVAQSPISGDSRVLQIKLAIGEGAAGEGWPPDHYKNVYVDEITINGVTHDLEPRVINDTTKAGYNTIQDAIDNARPSDTVLVHPGTYTESVTVNKSKITLVSVDGSGSTIITPPDTSTQTFIIDTPQLLEDITVKGFTLKAPYVGFVTMVHWMGDGWHDGIEIKNLTVQDVVIDGLGTGWGINLFDTENATFTDLTIKNTTAQALDLAGVQGFKIERSVITNCPDGVRVFSRPGKYAPNGNIEIHYSSFVEIGGYAIKNEDATVTVDATLNWWGDPNGPGGVGPGTSDNVSENVNYASWLPRPLPTISDISVSGVTTTSATITWTTALPADSRVEYGPSIAYGLTSSIPDLTTSHSVGLTGLTPSTTYHFRVKSEDAYGHVDTFENLTFITAPPPPGTLKVDTMPVKAEIFVNRASWGIAPRTRSVAPGTYTILFADVPDFETPAPLTVKISSGEARTIVGVYEPELVENISPTIQIPLITPDAPQTIGVENTSVTQVDIEVEADVSNCSLTVQELTGKPAGLAIAAPGATYKYLNFVVENITDVQVKAVTITFKVEKTWISGQQINGETICLTRFDPASGEWTSLPTERVGEDATYVYFSAVSPGFSIYAVSGATLAPASFEFSNLRVSPPEVGVRESTTISIDVMNTGELEGTYTVALKMDEAVVETQDVTLALGASTTVTFTVSEDVAGTHTVNVAGLTGSFVVTAPAPPIVLLAVSIVLAIGIVMWLWKIR